MVAATGMKLQDPINTPVNNVWRVVGTNLHDRPNRETTERNTALARFIEKNSPLRTAYPDSISQEGNGSPVEHPSFINKPQQILAKIAGTEFWANIFNRLNHDGRVNMNDIVEAVNSGLNTARNSFSQATNEIYEEQNSSHDGTPEMASSILKALHSEIGRNSNSDGPFDLT